MLINIILKTVATVTMVTVTTQSSTSLRVTWTSLNFPDSYEVFYQLTNKDQCDNTVGTRTSVYKGNDLTAVIDGLIPYSTYNVFVKSIDSTCDGDEMKSSGTTGETGKLLITLINYKVKNLYGTKTSLKTKCSSYIFKMKFSCYINPKSNFMTC